MTAEERERGELARRSVHGYRTYGAHATAVLGAVTMIRETRLETKRRSREILWSLNSPSLRAVLSEVFGSVGVGREICRVTPSWGTHI